MVRPVGNTAPVGALETALMVTPGELVEDEALKCPASPPTRAATSKSEMREDHGERSDERTGIGGWPPKLGSAPGPAALGASLADGPPTDGIAGSEVTPAEVVADSVPTACGGVGDVVSGSTGGGVEDSIEGSPAGVGGLMSSGRAGVVQDAR